MADVQTGGGRGMKPWLRVLLVVSLALNFLIVGTLGGMMMMWSKWQPHHPARMDMAGGGPLTRALSDEDRRAIGRQMRKAYKQGGVPHADMRAELEALVADLKADPFDTEAVKARLAHHRSIFDERFALGQALLLDHLSAMSVEDRSAYADRLREGLHKRKSDRPRKHEAE